MIDRGIHPDLLEEEHAAEQAAPEESPPSPPPARGRGRAAAARRGETAPEPQEQTTSSDQQETANDLAPRPEASDDSPPETTEVPEWLTQARAADDPKEMLRLLAANLPPDDIAKNERVAGLLGELANRRARAMLQQEQQEAIERQKREAVAQGDYYGLGQMTAAEVQRRAEEHAAAQGAAPFMDGVVAFQQKLPPEVQLEVQGKPFGAGKSYSDGVSEYLDAVTQATVNHRLNEAVEKEIKRREPALRKAWLSESNGSGPTPEVDGGPAPGVREVTDEQVAAMSLAEYNALFDENGVPKPGVRHRATRGVPLTQR